MQELNRISQKIYGINFKELDFEERWVVEKEFKEKSYIGVQGGDYYKPLDK
jgi:hypothetical protein